ncbi:hypothetical protein WI89_30630 [Burkholderia ubonensis]|nr:hypothetical protein WI89_30630 [Burkholderia ubonensis]
MIPRRFVHAVDSTRPYYAHRYDLFGLKIGRRLTLFGQDALDLWIRLELDPHVLAYCDRPMCIPDTKPSRLVDFWVRTFDGEKLCIRVAFRGAAQLHGDTVCFRHSRCGAGRVRCRST